jgi:hypothetical protein
VTRFGARAALAACAALIGAVALAAPSPSPAITAQHFSHAEHHKRGLDIQKCDACHSVDASGIVAPPATQGHSPCLSAGCHATAFVSTGPTTKAKDPAAFGKATAFCLGCHDSPDGSPPSPAQHNVATAAMRSYQLESEYHVEMNHFEHTKRAQCRDCHVVDTTSFALVATAPGHAQCVTCHNAQKFPDFTMSKCAYCHAQPGRSEFFHASRPHTDVRACGSEGHAALVAKAAGDGKPVACFRHERTEHRFTADNKPVQCNECHSIVATPDRGSLATLHASPVIDNTEAEHTRCGSSNACHAKDFSNASGSKRCLVCHGDHARSLFD